MQLIFGFVAILVSIALLRSGISLIILIIKNLISGAELFKKFGFILWLSVFLICLIAVSFSPFLALFGRIEINFVEWMKLSIFAFISLVLFSNYSSELLAELSGEFREKISVVIGLLVSLFLPLGLIALSLLCIWTGTSNLGLNLGF